ncbi:hypothetical protein PUN28_007461 [Cardiocondyla obscurior]|uniref:Uncharacterized protein n=1 Tax=Cardiocondyla obscurior TaxID=286306 RepID=A0AAW2G9M7_9HYME
MKARRSNYVRARSPTFTAARPVIAAKWPFYDGGKYHFPKTIRSVDESTGLRRTCLVHVVIMIAILNSGMLPVTNYADLIRSRFLKLIYNTSRFIKGTEYCRKKKSPVIVKKNIIIKTSRKMVKKKELRLEKVCSIKFTDMHITVLLKSTEHVKNYFSRCLLREIIIPDIFLFYMQLLLTIIINIFEFNVALLTSLQPAFAKMSVVCSQISVPVNRPDLEQNGSRIRDTPRSFALSRGKSRVLELCKSFFPS